MNLLIKTFNVSEIRNVILTEINPKKAPKFDLITIKILQDIRPNCMGTLYTYSMPFSGWNIFTNSGKLLKSCCKILGKVTMK